MSDWQITSPPNGIPLELVTTTGKTLTGAVSFVRTYRDAQGIKRVQYQLRQGGAGVFEVARWRRVPMDA